MYLETMTVDEKVEELQKVENKLFKIGKSIVDRAQYKIKKGETKDLGTKRVVINGTEYFYILSTKKAKNKINGTIYYSMDLIPYTIQTHSSNGLKYVVSFDFSQRKNNGIVRISEYEYHVFVRYRERFLNNNSSLSLDNYCIERFFRRNNDGVLTFTDRGIVNIVPDGILLGTIEDSRLYNYKTFIVEEQLKEDQMLWSKYGELWEKYKTVSNTINNDPYLINGYNIISEGNMLREKAVEDYLQKRNTE